MSMDVRPYQDGDLETMRALARHPSIAGEYDVLQGPQGLESAFGDPFAAPELRWIGWLDGTPAGFLYTFVLPSPGGRFAVARLAVVESARRRGLGSTLLDTVRRALRAESGVTELCLAAWQPNEAAAAFAARHEFARVRTTWLMDRPSDGAVAVAWPKGIEARVFDGTDAALADWNDAYNVSFARHYHYVISTPADCRAILARPCSEPSGLMLAYREGECVGFCRNDLLGLRGEIGVLGVDPRARGIGLGRALLRWGVSWLERRGAPRVTLTVDGENESALRLYRSERFEAVRSRATWARHDF